MHLAPYNYIYIISVTTILGDSYSHPLSDMRKIRTIADKEFKPGFPNPQPMIFPLESVGSRFSDFLDQHNTHKHTHTYKIVGPHEDGNILFF